MVAVMEKGLALQDVSDASVGLELCVAGRPWRGFAHPLSFVRKQVEELCLEAARYSVSALRVIRDEPTAGHVQAVLTADKTSSSPHADVSVSRGEKVFI